MFDNVEMLGEAESSNFGLLDFLFLEILSEILDTTPTLIFSDLIDLFGDISNGLRGNRSFLKLLFPNFEETLSAFVELLFNFYFFIMFLLRELFFPVGALFTLQVLSLQLFSFSEVVITLFVFIGGVATGVLEYLKNKNRNFKFQI